MQPTFNEIAGVAFGAYRDARVTNAPERRDPAAQPPAQTTGSAVARREDVARETAERLAAMTASNVRVSVAADGSVEISKGRAATRLTSEEARAVKELLIKLTA